MISKIQYNEIKENYNSLELLYNTEKERILNEINQLKDKYNKLQNQFYQKEQTFITELNDYSIKIKELEKINLNNEKEINKKNNNIEEFKNILKNIKIIFEFKNKNYLKELIEEINKLLNKFNLELINNNKINNYNLIYLENLIIKPEIETLLVKHQKILIAVRKELMSFLKVPDINNNNNNDLEIQLDQLHELVTRIKKLFIEREQNIEEMAKLVSIQHESLMQLSNPINDKQLINKSFLTYNKSNQILNEDRKNKLKII